MVSVLPSASLHHFPGIAALVQALVEVRFFGSSVLQISRSEGPIAILPFFRP